MKKSKLLSAEISELVGTQTLHQFASRIADKVGCSARYIRYILLNERRPSPKVADALESETGYNRLFWLYREQYGTNGTKLDVS